MRVSLVDPSLFTLPYDRALAHGLTQAGHDVTLHGRRPGPDDSEAGDVRLAPDFYRASGHPLMARLPAPLRLAVKGLDHAFSMTRLLRRLRRERPDVIHFQWLPLPLVDGRLLSGFRALAPLVLTVHDTNPFNGDPTAGLQRHGFLRCVEAFDRVIVHTAQGRDRMQRQGIPAERLVLLPHGLLAPLPPAAQDPMRGPLTLTLFGKIKPYKGADLLIEAFAGLPDDLRSQARIRIVGKPYMDLGPLHQQVAEHDLAGQVSIEPRFIGDEEIGDLFAAGVVAVFPYREIEASGVLPYALSHGRPVIASNLGSFAETLVDGVQGHLVLPGDVAALRAAIAHLLKDRAFAAACSANAWNTADQTPDWRTIGQQTADTYRAAGGVTGGVLPALAS